MALKILVLRPSPKTVKIPATFKKKVLPDSGRVQSTPQGAWMSNWVCGRWCPEPKCSCTGGIAGWVLLAGFRGPKEVHLPPKKVGFEPGSNTIFRISKNLVYTGTVAR